MMNHTIAEAMRSPMSAFCCYSNCALKMHLGRRQIIRTLTSPILWEQNTIIARLPHTILIPGTTLSMQRSGMRSATSTGRGKLVAFSAGVAEAGGSASKSENREIMVQHILVPEDQLKLLLELQHKIVKEGVDLSDLATEYSICSSKEEGGVLGWIRKGQMVQEFEEAAFSSPLNKLVRCKTKLGWHLLQVLAEREGGLLEDIEPEELYIKMQEQNFINEAQLMDVREPDEISIASLSGFKIYPLHQFGSWAPTITDNLDPMKDTYVLCHHGMRSLQVAKWLQTQGFKRIYNVSGGIHAYSKKVDASIPTY